MCKHLNEIMSVDRLEEARRRDEDLGRSPGDTTLAEWGEDWMQSGAIATSEVLKGTLLNGEDSSICIFACRLPLTAVEMINLFAVNLQHLIKANVLESDDPPQPSKKPRSAPLSNTGLSDTNLPHKRGEAWTEAEVEAIIKDTGFTI